MKVVITRVISASNTKWVLNNYCSTATHWDHKKVFYQLNFKFVAVPHLRAANNHLWSHWYSFCRFQAQYIGLTNLLYPELKFYFFFKGSLIISTEINTFYMIVLKWDALFDWLSYLDCAPVKLDRCPRYTFQLGSLTRKES